MARPDVALERFQISRYLRRDQYGFTAIGSDQLSPGPDVLVKMVRRTRFSARRTTMMSFYSWLETHTHPNIGQILAAGIAPNHDLYWVRPFYPHTTVPEDGVRIIKGLVAAVRSFHANDQLHRRIRPANVFFEDGEPILTDPFCCIRLYSSNNDIHFEASASTCTNLDTKEADLYALGSTLHRILTGRYLFNDPDISVLRSKYALAAQPPLRARLPERVARLVERLTSRHPDERTEAFTELAHSLGATSASSMPAYCGRDEELCAVESHLKTQAHPMSVISVQGPSGIGKTAFLQQLERRHCFYSSPCDFLSLSCRLSASLIELVRDPLYRLVTIRSLRDHSTFSQILGPYGDLLTRELWSKEATHSFHALTDRIANDIVGLVARLSTSRPIVVAVDNANEGSADVLAFFRQMCMRAADISGHLVLVESPRDSHSSLGTKLISDAGITNYRMLSLLPLTEQVQVRFLKNLGGTLDPSISPTMEGSPYFLLLALQTPLSAWRIRPVSDWLAHALRLLTTNARTLIDTLAVFGAPVATSQLRVLARLDDAEFEEACSLASSPWQKSEY